MLSYLLYRLSVALGMPSIFSRDSANTVASSGGTAALPKRVCIGTRSSKLARAQTDIVVQLIAAAFPEVELVVVDKETQGDKNQTTPLHNIGAKSLWTKELEVMLLDGELDMIVHSLKDMPTTLPGGCTIGAIVEREDPRDAFVARSGSPYTTLSSLLPGSVVGTSSVRRMAQLRRFYPHLVLKDMRGNIHTRLRKLDTPDPGAQEFDGLILAAAGLIRMDWSSRCSELLEHPTMLWGVGQGAIGVEIREGDEPVRRLLECCNDTATMLACLSEREVMRTLEGGCSVPIGVDTYWIDGPEGRRLRMRALVASVDGQECAETELLGKVESVQDTTRFGREVAASLIAMGAQPILDKVNAERGGHGQAPDL